MRDFAVVDKAERVTRELAASALSLLEVDARGLDQMDRRYLSVIAEILRRWSGRRRDDRRRRLSEPRDAIEDIIEPYLIQQGLLQRTPRGRLLTPHAFRHLGLEEPSETGSRPVRPCSGTATTMPDDRHPVLHRLSLRVYYEDTDFSGAVYHASYLRFFERARTEWLRGIGFDQRTAFAAIPPLSFVVKRLSIDYLRPALWTM